MIQGNFTLNTHSILKTIIASAAIDLQHRKERHDAENNSLSVRQTVLVAVFVNDASIDFVHFFRTASEKHVTVFLDFIDRGVFTVGVEAA